MMVDADKTNTFPITSARRFLKDRGVDANEKDIQVSPFLSVDDQRRVKKHHLVSLMIKHGIDGEFFDRYWRRGCTDDGRRILAMYARKNSKNEYFLGVEVAYGSFGMPANIIPAAGSSPDEIDLQNIIGYEGGADYRIHLQRERDRKLVEAKRRHVLSSGGRLECEACGFDFESRYGVLGRGFCEVHHRAPLSKRTSASKTRISDLAVLCSNCHRMIHRTKPLMSVEEFKETFFSE